MNKKLIWGVVIVVVVIALVAVYINQGTADFGAKRKLQQYETTKTADWKTYTNEKYGFEFQYPANADVYDVCCQGKMVADLVVYPPRSVEAEDETARLNKAVFLQLHDDDDQTFSAVEVRHESPNSMDINIGTRRMGIMIFPSGDKDLFKIISSTFKFTSSSTQTDNTLNVIYPNGGETVKIGNNVDLKWNGGRNPLEIMLETYSEGELVTSGWIATKIDPATGKYTWKVGQIYNSLETGQRVNSIVPPGKYYLRLSDFKIGDLGRSQQPFTITN